MRNLVVGAILVIALSTPAMAQTTGPAAAEAVRPAAEPLVGDWLVDLTGKPGDGPYYADMHVESVEGDRITGTFYGSRIEHGRINRSWGTVRFAFVTHDQGGGTYNHSGEYVDGRLIRGVSHAVDRDFVMPWVAVRGKLPPS
ncbi:MAG: hypothetical protein K1X35_07960 [Caulobacteraceae bacterium]|nr:hypothetical protein [Caulobacteraceae bacterium]